MQTSARVILDLCGGTGAWSAPYRAAGYDVRLITAPWWDVRDYAPPSRVHGVLAAPPCTYYARVGARWWATVKPERLERANAIVRACLAIIKQTTPAWWCLENPIGRIAQCVPELGPPRFKADPCDFGDPWTKRLWLWGEFTPPLPLFGRCMPVAPEVRADVRPGMRDRTSLLPGARTRERAATSPAFARAFFEANP